MWLIGASTCNYLVSIAWKAEPGIVDVRQNGIILGQFRFVPWSDLRGFRWSKFTDDLMLLNEGSFIEKKVPKAQRETLEAALKEFLPKKAGFS